MLKDLKVNRDLFNVNLVMKSDVDITNLTYYLKVDSWTPSKLEVSVNFSDPMLISQGAMRDSMYLTVKKPEFFISGLSYKQFDTSKTILKVNLPR